MRERSDLLARQGLNAADDLPARAPSAAISPALRALYPAGLAPRLSQRRLASGVGDDRHQRLD